MKAKQEGLLRLAQRRSAQLGTLSSEAFDELMLAVKKDPDTFATTDADRAFLALGAALANNEQARMGEEFLDDTSYECARTRRLARLAEKCRAALEIDPACLDAKTIEAMVTHRDSGEALEALLALEEELGSPEPTSFSWDNALCRPHLRLKGAIVRALLETTRFRAAIAACEELVALEPSDPLGARYTWALACARLEDEAAFNELDARFGRAGNAWSHIARTLLMFKLNRWSAACRALRGYASLCEGGAYALMRPIYIEGYLPDRPAFTPGTFEEAALAVHEADPVVADTPDFIAWVSTQEDFMADAKRFAAKNDLEW